MITWSVTVGRVGLHCFLTETVEVSAWTGAAADETALEIARAKGRSWMVLPRLTKKLSGSYEA